MTVEIAQQAFDLLTGVVEHLAEADWDRQSNLDVWTIRDVVAHVTGSVAKVRSLAMDEPIMQLRSDPADWQDTDPAAALRGACRDAVAALAAADLHAPRQMRGAQMPLSAAVTFPIVDAVVHAWDIRRSLGESLEVPGPLLDYATRLTDRVGEAPNPNFAPPIDPSPGATATEVLMNRLGRPTT